MATTIINIINANQRDNVPESITVERISNFLSDQLYLQDPETYYKLPKGWINNLATLYVKETIDPTNYYTNDYHRHFMKFVLKDEEIIYEFEENVYNLPDSLRHLESTKERSVSPIDLYCNASPASSVTEFDTTVRHRKPNKEDFKRGRNSSWEEEMDKALYSSSNISPVKVSDNKDPKHQPKKKKANSKIRGKRYDYAEPQSASPEASIFDLLGTFKVGLDTKTSVLLENVLNKVHETSDTLKSALPDGETYQKLLDLIETLKNKAVEVGDTDTVRTIVSTLRSTARSAPGFIAKALTSATNFCLNMNAFIACLLAYYYPSVYNITLAIITILMAIILKADVNTGRSYLSQMLAWAINKFTGHVPPEPAIEGVVVNMETMFARDEGISLSNPAAPIPPGINPNFNPRIHGYWTHGPDGAPPVWTSSMQDPHEPNSDTEIPQPQAGMEDVDEGIELFTTCFASYVSFTSGKNVPIELFKNLGHSGRVANTLTGVAKVLIGLFEKAINWIRNECYNTESLRFFESRSAIINQYLDDVDTIMEISRKGMLFDNRENIARCDSMVKVGTQLLLKIPRDKHSTNSIQLITECIRKLEKVLTKLTACNLAFKGTRQEPTGLLIRGGAGAGKTVIMEHVYRAFMAMVLDEDLFKQFKRNPYEFVYNRQAETKYWDKYTFQKWVCLFDDFLQVRDVLGVTDGEASNIIRAINTFENVLHSAGMDEKGIMTFSSLFVVATTNVRSMAKVIQSIESHEALLRRFVVDVICAPKIEYCTTDTKDLSVWDRKFDPKKLPTVEYLDMETKNLPGLKTTTALIPDIQEFYILKNEQIVGTPISFIELMQLVMGHYEDRRAWHLSQKVQFDKTLDSYRDIYNQVVPQSGSMPGNYVHYNDEGVEREEIPFTPHISGEPWGGDPFDLGKDDDLEFSMDDDIYSETLPIRDFENNIQDATAMLLKEISRFDWDEKSDFLANCSTLSKIVYDVDIFDRLHPSVAYAMLIRDLKNPFLEVFNDHNRFLRFITQCTVKRIRRKPMLPGIKLHDWVPGERKKKFSSYMEEFLEPFHTNPLVILWKESSWIKTTLFAILGVVGSVVGVKIIGAIYTWMTGKAVPESFGFNSKGHTPKSTRPCLTPGQLRAKHGPGILHAQSGGSDPAGSDLIDKLIRTNTFNVMVETGENTNEWRSPGTCVFYLPQVAHMPYHYLLMWSWYVDKNPSNANARVRLCPIGSFEKSVCEVNIDFMLSNFVSQSLQILEQAMVNFGHRMQPRRNILKHVSKVSDWKVKMTGIPFVMAIPKKGKMTGFASALDYPVTVTSEETGSYTLPKYYSYQGFTDEGDCGALFCVLNSHNPERKIFGMHVAGHSRGGPSYSVPTFQEDILEDLKLFKNLVPEILTEDVGELIQPECKVNLSRGQFGMIGILKKAPREVRNDAIRKSLMYGTYHTPICESAQMVEKDGVKPLDYALSKYCPDAIYLSWLELKRVRLDLYAHLKHVHFTTYTKRLLTFEESVYGVDTVPELKGIVLSTGDGYPGNILGNMAIKKQLTKLNRDDPDFKIKFDKILIPVQEYEDKILNNIRPIMPYFDFPKNETRPIGKATRFISGAPTELGILFNKYFGFFNAEFIANRITNGSAIGINVYSMEWDQLVKSLGRFSFILKPGAGDYSAYDASLSSQLLWEVLNLANMWYNDGLVNQRARKMLWYEIVNSRHILGSILYEWWNGMPSGNPMTPIINTIVNMLLFRLSFDRLVEPIIPKPSYDDCVVAKFYGDDNIFTVSDVVKEYFNEMTLADMMLNFGMNYTTEFKGKAVSPFRPITEVEFLKRRFRFLAKDNRWIAPLRLEVILNTPCWTKYGPEEYQTPAGNIIFALRELSLHEEEIFDEWAPKLITSFENNYPGLPTAISLYTPYDKLQALVLKSECYY